MKAPKWPAANEEAVPSAASPTARSKTCETRAVAQPQRSRPRSRHGPTHPSYASPVGNTSTDDPLPSRPKLWNPRKMHTQTAFKALSMLACVMSSPDRAPDDISYRTWPALRQMKDEHGEEYEPSSWQHAQRTGRRARTCLASWD